MGAGAGARAALPPGGTDLTPGDPRALRDLARRSGIQLVYRDASGRTRRAGPRSLRAGLAALGVPAEDDREIAASLAEAGRREWGRLAPPVVVAWHGRRLRVPLRVPDRPGLRVRYAIGLEDGSSADGGGDLDGAPVVDRGVHRGRDRVVRLAMLPERPPPGYHRLEVRVGRRRADALVICAPRRAVELSPEPAWGVFAPAYALRSTRDRGVGDLTDVGELLEWVSGLGGSVVATLPLFATFLDEPFEPSPYSPVSRLFWNELFLDLEAAPELAASAEARAVVAGPRGRRAEVPGAGLVDYRGAMGWKRRALGAMAETLFTGDSQRRRALEEWASPRARDYAAFRAAVERSGGAWDTWPARERGGRLTVPADDPAARRHLYAQWLFEEQVGRTARDGDGERGLLLDLPLGVHVAGYDPWRFRDVFALDATGGAPPDPLAPGGQDWQFPPLHPARLEESGFEYVIDTVRHLLRHAAVARLDHVMGLHRMFWIPRGLAPTEGVYVRSPTEALYAIASLESHRHGTPIVGEDLGTVPAVVRRTMRRHGINRTYVLQFELHPTRRAIGAVPEDAVAAVNTHDMPPFAAFWTDADLDEREGLGVTDPDAAAGERARRERLREALAAALAAEGWLPGGRARRAGTNAVYTASLQHLGASPARLVLANLEDAWGETRSQNVPGTTRERPNWRGRARHTLEDLRSRPALREPLAALDRARRAESPEAGRAAGGER